MQHTQQTHTHTSHLYSALHTHTPQCLHPVSVIACRTLQSPAPHKPQDDLKPGPTLHYYSPQASEHQNGGGGARGEAASTDAAHTQLYTCSPEHMCIATQHTCTHNVSVPPHVHCTCAHGRCLHLLEHTSRYAHAHTEIQAKNHTQHTMTAHIGITDLTHVCNTCSVCIHDI